ncbi:unnamed protein product, partial [marine sediment metagenome]
YFFLLSSINSKINEILSFQEIRFYFDFMTTKNNS